jgi:hypothetical protein
MLAPEFMSFTTLLTHRVGLCFPGDHSFFIEMDEIVLIYLKLVLI